MKLLSIVGWIVGAAILVGTLAMIAVIGAPILALIFALGFMAKGV